MTKVGLVKGDDRFTNVFQALVNAGEAVKQKVRGKVVIKVNTVMKGAPLANTHPGALRAVSEFPKCSGSLPKISGIWFTAPSTDMGPAISRR